VIEVKETALFEESDIIVLMVVVLFQYNFACCFIWTRSMVPQIEGGTRLRVFQNRVLKKIFGPKRDKVTSVPDKMLFG
jgi:hypothetical protein